jgi:hypothetical protein
MKFFVVLPPPYYNICYQLSDISAGVMCIIGQVFMVAAFMTHRADSNRVIAETSSNSSFLLGGFLLMNLALTTLGTW